MTAPALAAADYDGRWNAMGRGSSFSISGDKITLDEGLGFRLRFIEKRNAKWDFQGSPKEGAIFQAVMPNGSDLPAQWFCGALDPVRYVVLSQSDSQTWAMTLFRGKDVPQSYNDQACSVDHYQRVAQPVTQQDTIPADETRQVQIALKTLGYYGGAVDGSMGRQTVSAIRKFQSSISVAATGRLTDPERALLAQRAGSGPGAKTGNDGPRIPRRFQGIWQHMEGATRTCRASDWGSDRHSDTHFKVTDKGYEAAESVCRITGLRTGPNSAEGPIHVRWSCSGEGNDFKAVELWQTTKIKGEEMLIVAPAPENDQQELGYIIAFQKCN